MNIDELIEHMEESDNFNAVDVGLAEETRDRRVAEVKKEMLETDKILLKKDINEAKEDLEELQLELIKMEGRGFELADELQEVLDNIECMLERRT
jgi:hypothetical protein